MIRRPLEDQARRRAVFQAGVVYRCRPGSGGSQHRPLLGSRRHQKTEFNDLDWTVGVKLGHDRSGCYWLLDMVRARANPGDIERLLAQYCRARPQKRAHRVRQGSGASWQDRGTPPVRALSRFTVTPAPESGDKLTRFGPFRSQRQAGNVKIQRGSWNEDLFRLGASCTACCR